MTNSFSIKQMSFFTKCGIFVYKMSFAHFRVVLFAKRTPLREKESFAHFRGTPRKVTEDCDFVQIPDRLKYEYLHILLGMVMLAGLRGIGTD